MKNMLAFIIGFAIFCSIPAAGIANVTQSGASVGIQSAMDDESQPSNSSQNGISQNKNVSNQTVPGLGISLRIPRIDASGDPFAASQDAGYKEGYNVSFRGPVQVMDYRGTGVGWTLKTTAVRLSGPHNTVLIATKSSGADVANQNTLGELMLHNQDRIISDGPVVIASAPHGVGMGDVTIHFPANALRVVQMENGTLVHDGLRQKNSMDDVAFLLRWSLEDAPQ